MQFNVDNDKLLKSFFGNQENIELFEAYLLNPTEKNKEFLDEQFELHKYVARCTAYLSKAIFYKSQHFDKKVRKDRQTYQLILNDDKDGQKPLIEIIPNINELYISSDVQEIEENFDDQKLKEAMKILTEKQKRIIYLIYFEELRDREVAALLNISQQAVTKTKKIALRKIRKEYEDNG